jgi:hypothetical protein
MMLALSGDGFGHQITDPGLRRMLKEASRRIMSAAAPNNCRRWILNDVNGPAMLRATPIQLAPLNMLSAAELALMEIPGKVANGLDALKIVLVWMGVGIPSEIFQKNS